MGNDVKVGQAGTNLAVDPTPDGGPEVDLDAGAEIGQTQGIVPADQFTDNERDAFAALKAGDAGAGIIKSLIWSGVNPIEFKNEDGEWFVSLAHSNGPIFRALVDNLPQTDVVDALSQAAEEKKAKRIHLAGLAEGPAKDPNDPGNRIDQTLWDFMVGQDWPSHHSGWHQMHQFGGINPNSSMIPVQGTAVGGIEFGAFHQVKIERMRQAVEELVEPAQRQPLLDMLKGWDSIETDPGSPDYLFGDAVIPEDIKSEIARFQDVEKLAAEYPPVFDTSARWTIPDRFRLGDGQEGTPGTYGPLDAMLNELEAVHNEIHGLLSRSGTGALDPIDMGSSQTNIFNVLFWGLHGWVQTRIDGFIEAYKAQHSNEPEVLASFEKEIALYQERIETSRIFLKIDPAPPGFHAAHEDMDPKPVPDIFLNHPPIG
jgi:hypothetical protein